MPIPTLPSPPGWSFTQPADDYDVFLGPGPVATKVAVGSNGVNISTFVGAQSLYVDSVQGFPETGTLAVDTSDGVGQGAVTYTGVNVTSTGTTFTGCTGSGSGTFATGGNVVLAPPGSYSGNYGSQSAYNCVQLSDGTGIVLYAWSGLYFLLATQQGKTSIIAIGTAGLADGLDAAYCLAVDSSDNLYVVRGYNLGPMYVWKWGRSGANNAWSLTFAATENTDTNAQWTAMNAVWCDTGGAGHLVVATSNSLIAIDASTGSTTDTSFSPDNSQAMACCNCAIGGNYGILVATGQGSGPYTVKVYGWSISGGTLTVSSAATLDDTSTNLPTNDFNFAPHVRYAGGSTWFVLYEDVFGNLIGNVAYTASGGTPTPGAAGPQPAPSLAGVAHLVPHRYGAEVGSYTEFSIADTSNLCWVVTRVPGTISNILRQQVKVTTGASPAIVWGLLAFQVATGMDTSSTSVICCGEPQCAQVDVVVGTVPGAVTTFAIQGTAVQPIYQPAAPTLVGPTWGSVTDPVNTEPQFSFTIDPDEAQEDYVLVTEPWGGGSQQYWTGSEWTQFEIRRALSGLTPVGDVYTETVSEDEFTPEGASYGWKILTWDEHDICSVIPFPSKVTFAVAPEADSIAVNLDTISRPTVSWTFVPGTTGAVQAVYRVMIGPSGWNPATTTPTLDSGLLSGAATSWAIPNPILDPETPGAGFLANGSAYDAYVFVQDVLGGTNGPITTGSNKVSWTVSYSAMAAPSLAASAPSDGSGVGLAAAGVTNGNLIEFEYSYDGTNWQGDVRGSPVTISGGSAELTDYDMVGNSIGGLFRTAIYYRARQIDGTYQFVSTWADSDPSNVSIPEYIGYFWLKYPANPALNAKVQVMPPWSVPLEMVASAYTQLGAQQNVVVSDGLRGPSGDATFITIQPPGSDTDYSELLDLLLLAQNPDTPAPVYLIQNPYGDSFYVQFITTIDGELQFSPQNIPYRETKVSYVNVGRP